MISATGAGMTPEVDRLGSLATVRRSVTILGYGPEAPRAPDWPTPCNLRCDVGTGIVTATLNPCIDKGVSVERVLPDRKLSATNVRQDPGGGGLNVARAISHLGGEALALWSAGGPIGELLEQLLRREEIPNRPIRITGVTRENLIVEETSTNQYYRFGLPGPALRPDELDAWIDAIEALAPKPDYFVISGSLPPEVPPGFMKRLIGVVPAQTRVVVDSKQEALRAALEAGVYLVKPNVHELSELMERELYGDDDIEEAARGLITQNRVEVVLVSLGKGGALLVTREACVHVRSPSVKPRSKVGAGDSMVGGLVLGLSQERSLEDAVTLGVAAGAAAVMTPGTELCRRGDAYDLYEKLAQRHDFLGSASG